jgi:hypothetical protein
MTPLHQHIHVCVGDRQRRSHRDNDLGFTSINYSSFDNVVSLVQKLGQGALIGKDIESAFRLVPCYPGDFDLLGLKIGPMQKF